MLRSPLCGFFRLTHAYRRMGQIEVAVIVGVDIGIDGSGGLNEYLKLTVITWRKKHC